VEARDILLARPCWITVADYLWNPEAYDPEQALARAFQSMGGSDTVRRAWLESRKRPADPERLRAALKPAAALRDPGFRDHLLQRLRLILGDEY
jgi:hypothetical protein